MKDNYIEITGITPLCKFPECTCKELCTQLCETHRFSILNHKPNIESILQVIADVSVCSFEIISTTLGKKVVIEGMKHIKILYVSDEPCQNVYSAHYDIPFCTFILLDSINCEVADIFLGIEYISCHKIECRSFSVSMIIFVCPIFKETNKDHCNKNINYNININCHPDVNCNVNCDNHKCKK